VSHGLLPYVGTYLGYINSLQYGAHYNLMYIYG